MRDDAFHQMMSDAQAALQKEHLTDALMQVGGLLHLYPQWQLQEEFDDIQATYRLLLDYFGKGFADQQRHSQFHRLIQRTWLLLDRMTLHVQSLQSSTLWHVTLATVQSRPPMPLRDLRGAQLFDRIWTLDTLPDETEMDELLILWPQVDAALAISALFVRTLQVFDEHAMLLLIHIHQNTDDVHLSGRAFCAWMLCFVLHRQRLSHYPELSARLRLLSDDEGFLKSFVTLQMQLYMTSEASEIGRTMREEIIPGLMKSYRLREQAGLPPRADDDDANPDWHNPELDATTEKKLHRLIEMGQEGADVNLATFQNLKNFPFFHTPAHWFMPFTMQHPDVPSPADPKRENRSRLIHFVASSNQMCSSDKYSLLFMLRSLSDAHRSQIEGQIESQFDEAADDLPDDVRQRMNTYSFADTLQKATFNEVCRSFLQDIYRFFYLHPHRQEIPDPFSVDHHLLFVAPFDAALVRHPELMRRLADYLLKYRYFGPAYEAYQKLETTEGLSSELAQKMGYAQQMLAVLPQAVQHYRQADLLESDNLWTLRHLAACLRQMGQHHQALPLWEKLHTLRPDDVNLMLRLAECRFQTQDFEGALALYHKVEYLHPSHPEALRGIAASLLYVARYDEVVLTYQRLQPTDLTSLDHMRLGHALWLLHQVPGAIQSYIRAQSATKLFDADRALLLSLGLTPTDFRLMTEVVSQG